MTVVNGFRALLGASLVAWLGVGCTETVERAPVEAPTEVPRERGAALVGTPFQVRDLRVGARPDAYLRQPPTLFTTLGDTVLFGGSDTVHGVELWRTDGTFAGTSMVMDLIPGFGSSSPTHSLVMNGRLYFLAASTQVAGVGLWSTDGTTQGTVLLKSLRAGLGTFLTQRNGVLYVGASDSEASSVGFSLWKSDGTPEGTTLLRREPAEQGRYGGHSHAWAGDTLVFTATDDAHGMALWKSDGTPSGTTVVMQNPPPYHGLLTDGLTECGGKVLFWGARDLDRYSLWRTDGTDAGTVLVKDIDTAAPSSSGSLFPPELFCHGGTFYFSAWDAEAGRELWKSDGTPQGTVRMADLAPGTGGAFPGQFTAHGGAFFFWAGDVTAGHELWTSDGTPQGTRRLADLAPGTASSTQGLDILTMLSTPVGLFFMANDGVNGVELWKTDGTPGGTVRLTQHTTEGFDFTGLRGVWSRGALHFWGDDDELWRSDGTVPGTVRVARLANYTRGALEADRPGVDLGGTLFFAANNGTEERLWQTDGTSRGTVAVGGATSLQHPRYLTPFGARLLVVASEPFQSYSLWSVDASGAAPQKLGPFEYSGNALRPLVTAGSQAFYLDGYSFEGYSLWRTDGTPEGTLRLRHVGRPLPDWSPRLLTPLGSRVFFVASATWGHEELWTSDGTVDGTVRVMGLDAVERRVSFEHLVATKDRLYFWATTEARGRELWMSDGTEAGTRPLGAISAPGWWTFEPSNTAVVGNTLYFVTAPMGAPPELWKTDGGAPVKVYTFGTNEKVRPPAQLAVFGDTLVFWADDGVSGYQPWRSDGTAAGTVRIKTLRPGGASAVDIPGAFTRLGAKGPLVFSASDGPTGLELWRTNGTPEGTVRVADIVPGVASSAPRWMVTSGQHLYFPAWSPASGVELWAASWTVEDAEPPQVTCPATQVAQATSGQGGVVVYPAATATDSGGSLTLTYSHVSGSVFPLGDTEVRATATDSDGNVASCTFTVSVRDLTAPSLECPPSQSAVATSEAGATVTWPEAMASDAVSPAVTVTYVPAKGSVFPVGTTPVETTATDGHGNSRSCTFEVRVTPSGGEVDAGTPDGGSAQPDGGSPVPDAGTPGTPPPEDSSGCGCQQSGGAGTGLLGLMLLGLLSARRRRSGGGA
jgi:ELWxxDGT repeat protein